MRIAQEKVELFMRRLDESCPPTPELGNLEEGIRRGDFIQEELDEYRHALATGGLVEIADALGDLLYVILGTGVHHGIDLQPIFDEIHRSNMTKTPEETKTIKVVNGQEAKRCTKGSTYEAPQLAELLLIQSGDGYGHGV